MNTLKNIWVINDDGINAAGIAKLAEHALHFGEVTVIAPESQCSAMSQRLTLDHPIYLTEVPFQVKGVKKAYSVNGTPADCILSALDSGLFVPPDIVFSGINDGTNVGVDILYSGTVGAAMQALVYGIPAMAFSIDREAQDFSLVDEQMDDLIRDLLGKEIAYNELWNVNFPRSTPQEFAGIAYDRIPDNQFHARNIAPAAENTDLEAVANGYISIGKLKNMIL